MSEDTTQCTYNPSLCITAGELRSMGLEIPSDIPDCAYVPRSAWRIDIGETKVDEATGVCTAYLFVTFTKKFQWTEADPATHSGSRGG